MPFIEVTVDSKTLRPNGGWEFSFSGALSGTDELDLDELEDLPWGRVYGSARSEKATQRLAERWREHSEQGMSRYLTRLSENGWRGTRLHQSSLGLDVWISVGSADEPLWLSTLDAVLQSKHLNLEFLIGGELGPVTKNITGYDDFTFDAVPECSAQRRLESEVRGWRKLLCP